MIWRCGGKVVTCFVAALSLNGCDSASRHDLEGSYAFRAGDVQETLELKPDGAFAQKITIDGNAFTGAGEWVFEKPRGIKLRDFLVRFDTSSGKTIDPPQKYGAYLGFWNPQRKRIVFDNEGKYFLDQAASSEKPSR